MKTLTFACRVKSSLVEEDKAKEDSIITTKFAGLAVEGLFKEYDGQLEKVIFHNESWRGLNTQEQEGNFVMKIAEPTNGKIIATIKNCTIKNISGTRTDEGVVVGMKIQHQKSASQAAIESLVATNVNLSLESDEEILGQK